jgi:transcriptional regulator with XRE-family HTH domain
MIYQKIKEIADSKGISIRKIEIDTGITQSSIYHWNEIKPSVDKVAKVAKYLGVTVEELIGD